MRPITDIGQYKRQRNKPCYSRRRETFKKKKKKKNDDSHGSISEGEGEKEKEAESVLTSSSLLYDPNNRLTFPLDQLPPPSNVLQRFTQAFKNANDKNRKRHISRKTNTARRYPASTIRRDTSSRDADIQSTLSSVETSSSRQQRFTTRPAGSSSHQSNDLEDDYVDDDDDESVAYLNSTDEKREQSRNPLSEIRQSLPPFLSDISRPSKDQYQLEDISQHRQTPFPSRLFSSSSTPKSSNLASSSSSNRQIKLNDNIWSRQEQRLSSSSHNESIKKGNGRNIHTASREPSLLPPYPTRIKLEEDDDQQLLPTLPTQPWRNTAMDDSSDEFVFNRQSSPDWISAEF